MFLAQNMILKSQWRMHLWASFVVIIRSFMRCAHPQWVELFPRLSFEGQLLAIINRPTPHCLQGGLEWQHRWMSRFARIVYLIERSKKLVQARRAQQDQEKRRAMAQQPSLPPSERSGQLSSQPTRVRQQPAAADLFEGLSSWRRTAGLAPAGVAAQRWLQQVPFPHPRGSATLQPYWSVETGSLLPSGVPIFAFMKPHQ